MRFIASPSRAVYRMSLLLRRYRPYGALCVWWFVATKMSPLWGYFCGVCLRDVSFCVSRLEGRSVRSTERSEARKVATRSEAKGHAQIIKYLTKSISRKGILCKVCNGLTSAAFRLLTPCPFSFVHLLNRF